MEKEILSKNGIRATIPRLKILEFIINNKFITIKDIENNIQDIDPATIYRTLELFQEKEIIEKSIDNNEVVYNINEGHKHYIKCIKCNSVKEIHVCPIEESELDGFKITNHSLHIDGICSNCQKK